MSANVNEVTALVVAVNVALVAPAGTVTLAGTVTRAGWMFDSVTTAPPAGAGVPRITLPVEGVPPTTELGSNSTVRSTVNRRSGVVEGLACECCRDRDTWSCSSPRWS